MSSMYKVEKADILNNSFDVGLLNNMFQKSVNPGSLNVEVLIENKYDSRGFNNSGYQESHLPAF